MNTFNQQNQTTERELNWNDTIVEDSRPNLPLPEGYYMFKVSKFERGRSNATDKLPACNMAKLTFDIHSLEDGQKLKSVPFNLILHSSYEWKISQFFVGIGLKEKGAPLIMDWNNVLGKTGMCELNHRTWNDKTYDNVKHILDADERNEVLNNIQTNTQPQTAQQNDNPYPW